MKDNFIKLTDKLNRPFPSSRSRYLQHEAKFKTFLVKMSFIWMRIKIVFIPMASHLASSWNRGLRQLGNVLFAFERDSIADFLSVSLLTWWLALMKGWHSNLQLWISLRTEVFFYQLSWTNWLFFYPRPRRCSSFCCVFRFLFKEIYIKSLVPKGGKRF